jgi:hypothetical protein
MVGEQDMSTTRRAFFDLFGYVSLPGLLTRDIGWITDAFEGVWRAHPEVEHDGTKRTMYPDSMFNASPELARLIEHPQIVELCLDLLGEGYAYYGGDGNFYSGDTGWHSDVVAGGFPAKTKVRHLKIAFYLDHLSADTGALRVIPGSHMSGDAFGRGLEDKVGESERQLGVTGKDVPAVSLPIVPGDIVAFDHRLKHAAFGGSGRRRMFTMNLFEACRSKEQWDLNAEIFAQYGEEGVRELFGSAVLDDAPSERMRRIEHALDFTPALEAGFARRQAGGST